MAEASTAVRQGRSIYIENIHASVENGRIARYRINAKITFALESER